MITKALPLCIIATLLTAAPQRSGAQTPQSNILFSDSDEDMDLGEAPSQKGRDTSAEDKAMRLRKLVQSATKGETTVQEAPAVITILNEDDITDYGFRHILNALTFVPSFAEINAQYDNMPLIASLGNSQGILLVQDGVSMFDPIFNTQASIRRWPLETVKRIEVMSSPGGVLWGANSFFGITSIITKDYNDINGFQLGIGGGTGPGDQDVFRAYGMFGKDFGLIKVFAHLSGEFFRGPKYEYLPIRLMSGPPQPPGPVIYGGAEALSSSNPMNFYGSFSGKVHYKKFLLQWSLPFIGFPGFSQNLARANSLLAWPINSSSSLASIQSNNFNYLDRMAALKYKESLFNDKLGVDAKLYFTQYQRAMQPAVMLPFTPGSLNGMAFTTPATAQRSGLTLDFNYQFTKRTRVLFGGEAFYEWINGADFTLVAPLDANGNTDFSSIPLACPYNGSPVYDPNNPQNTTFLPGCRQPFIFDQSRVVTGLFASFQHKFQSNIIADAGLRVQTAPSGNVTYDPQFLPGISLVVPLAKSWFWKINYLTGFRAPIFANTGSNGRAVAWGADGTIKVESSQAVQTEINAVLIKNMGKIQELSLRVNYGYTMLDNFIRINQGQYYNSGPRQIHSVEALARLYLRGGHNLMLGYSFNYNIASGLIDGAITHSVPNQWFTFASVFRLTEKLDFISSVKIIGAYEDPNRINNTSVNTSTQSWLAWELVPSAGILSAGIRYKTKIANRKAEFSLMTYNLTDTRSYYTADYFQDFGASIETTPTKGQRFYFFANSKFYF